MAGKLTDKDHEEMDKCLSDVFDEIVAGNIEKDRFVGGMAHVIAAIDIGNTGEALSWFKERAKHFTLNDSFLSGGDKLT